MKSSQNQGINGKLMVLVVFVFSVLYRGLLLYRVIYPPGPDLGLHNSVINSLRIHGNFTYNYYHMGGGASLTHPGFHLFTYSLMVFTGLPDFFAQSFVGLFFSSVTVLIAFLLTEKVLGVSHAALTAAFLAAISMSDIEMLTWGGYPNVVTLALIPLVYYLWLRKKNPLKASVLATSILVGAIIITHSLSTFVFLVVVAPFMVYELFKLDKKAVLAHFSSVLIGAAISFPLIFEMVPIYMENVYSYMSVSALNEIERDIILTRKIPLELFLLMLIPFFSFFLFSKRYRGRFLDEISLLFGLWIIVPTLLTQSFIFGLYIDYYRLLYFTILPVSIFIALLIHHSSNFFAGMVAKSNEKLSFKPKIVYSLLLIGFLLISCNLKPFSAFPPALFKTADYYQVVHPAGFKAIEFIKQRTSGDSIFVADDGLGWWVSGFGERVTLASVKPRFLVLQREIEHALTARNILETSFIISNGFVEVREDGGYVGRHNPMLLLSSERFPDPYPVFYFNNSETKIFYEVQGNMMSTDISRIPVKEMKVSEDSKSASISIVRFDSHIKLIQRINLSRNSNFAIYSLTVENVAENVSVRYVCLILHSWGRIVNLEDSVGILYLNDKVCGQLIFKEKPLTRTFGKNFFKVMYSANNKEKIELEIVMGAYEIEMTRQKYVLSYMSNITSTWEKIKVDGGNLEVFDYRTVLAQKNISFIVCYSGSAETARFIHDPLFNLVFINDEISIFKVRRCAVICAGEK